jgi:hypothetical protein
LVLLCYKVRHPNDFIFLVIFDHISLLDYGHKVFSMANLALQSAPDLRNVLLVHHSVIAITKAVNVFRHRIATLGVPTWSRDSIGSEPEGLMASV